MTDIVKKFTLTMGIRSSSVHEEMDIFSRFNPVSTCDINTFQWLRPEIYLSLIIFKLKNKSNLGHHRDSFDDSRPSPVVDHHHPKPPPNPDYVPPSTTTTPLSPHLPPYAIDHRSIEPRPCLHWI